MSYTEQEMAKALDLTCAQLRYELVLGTLDYYAHLGTTDEREYQFSQINYSDNIRYWLCVQSGGHFYEIAHEDDRIVYICPQCDRKMYD